MLTVLIAEDDLMIADMMEEALIEHGYQVCGIARTVAEAVDLGFRHKPDLMVLDLRLARGGLGTEIPSKLALLGRIGVLYATANVSHIMLMAPDGDACLMKPFRSVDLVRGLEIVRNIVVTGAAQPPFPPGFQILRPPAVAVGNTVHA